MTEQGIEKLREKLGDGFEVTAGYNCAVITVKDIWKGVEFAACTETYVGVFDDVTQFRKGKVYRIDGVNNFYISVTSDDLGCKNGISSRFFKPSTEAAYVEQLKTKAKELYGEIKDGDSFVLTWIGNEDEISIRLDGKCDFYYYKETDLLTLHGFPLYKQGKWAKRVKEPIRVEFVSSSQGPAGGKITAWFQFEVSKDANIHSSGIHIAKCLEDYLNKS